MLFLISIFIVLIIQYQTKHYTIKDYDKFAKEYGIEYEVINCPQCGTKVPDTIDFCYRCNEILFEADEETVEILNKMKEAIEQHVKSDVIGNIIDMIYKIIFYFIESLIVYMLLVLLKKILIFSRKIYLKYKNRENK